MKILKGNYGECRFIDNMDPGYGLPSLEEKSRDLCLTDPPYNIKYKSKDSTKLDYNDDIANYKEFIFPRFEEMKRIATRLIFSCGRNMLEFWYKHEPPTDLIIHHKSNGSFGGFVSKFNHYEPYLYYGDKCHIYDSNVFDVIRQSNWANNKTLKTLHSSPKSINLFTLLIYPMGNSVIDPFLGSGTTAQVCETLGIPWLGYEIMEEYSVDIERRIKKGIKDHQTYRPPKVTRVTSLSDFVKSL